MFARKERAKLSSNADKIFGLEMKTPPCFLDGEIKSIVKTFFLIRVYSVEKILNLSEAVKSEMEIYVNQVETSLRF